VRSPPGYPLAARSGRLSLRPPRHRQAVQVLEEHPPAGIEPIEWLLLTPWAVATFADPGYTLGGAQALLFEHIGRPTVFASAAVS
jgi:hypothetical protein